MRTLIHRCGFGKLLTVAACGNSRPAPDVEALRAKAEQGDVSAQFNLGVMYDDGEGVPQDYAEAIRWYRVAAE